eukprot:CAMPEP_0117655766 /NCGR_PEP_ID=MMETSP0804-20121206/4452_1 /TAXON_ID=1074897 /ORGANISM="Tetraselmis astigmatica, Strain CCMP880" /LENGTH=762 /DNA_ID=CAMNT_0005462135 /DNA_START=98 /DNA_END=2387 /DNA_ORIENTATION=-
MGACLLCFGLVEAHDDGHGDDGKAAAKVLLTWKRTLPRGDCLGCQDGPVLRNWTAGTSICDWWDVVLIPHGQDDENEHVHDERRGVVRCSTSRRVIHKLDLSGMGLEGRLPIGFGQFKDISDLYLDRNKFSGPIPEEWSTIGMDAPNMDLRLSRNSISGTLPASWASRPNWLGIRLNGNLLSGSLPTEWSVFKGLTKLTLGANLLTGTLPAQWSNLQSLKVLAIDENKVVGSLPKAWGAFQELKRMTASLNQLSGTIPETWSEMKDLEQLFLSDNDLTGTLPAAFTSLNNAPPKMVALDVTENDLKITDSDSFPVLWAVQPQQGEKLTGIHQVLLDWKSTLPPGPCLGCAEGPVLRMFHPEKSICDWKEEVVIPRVGNEPVERGVTKCLISPQNVINLDLRDLSLVGSLPESFSNLAKIKYLKLDNNRFSGTLPDAWSHIGILSDEIEITASRNEITGKLPKWWGTNMAITRIDLSRNQIFGGLPQMWKDLYQLEKLQLNHNFELKGSLPSEWSELESLERLELQSCKLSGILPNSWSALSQISYMDLSENRFTGAIPASWCTLQASGRIDLSDNMLDPSSAWESTTWKPIPQSNKGESDPDNSSNGGVDDADYDIEDEVAVFMSSTDRGIPNAASMEEDQPKNKTGMYIAVGIIVVALLVAIVAAVLYRRSTKGGSSNILAGAGGGKAGKEGPSISLSEILMESSGYTPPKLERVAATTGNQVLAHTDAPLLLLIAAPSWALQQHTASSLEVNSFSLHMKL